MSNPPLNDKNTLHRMPVLDEMSRQIHPVGYDSAPDDAWYDSGAYQPQAYDGQPQGYGDAPYQPWTDGDGGYQPPSDGYGVYEPQGYAGGAYTPQQSGGHPWPGYNPLEETGLDISLARRRSRNVYEREGAFWEAPEAARPRRDKPAPRPRKYHGAHAAWKIILIVFVLGVISAVVYGSWYRVRTIDVVGNVYLTDEEIISLSGIRMGDRIMAVDEKKVAEGINKSRYLIFDKMDKQTPSTIVITVKERTPAAVMNYGSINYVLDNKGMVLEEDADVTALAHLPEVSGMELLGAYGASAGRKLNVNNQVQLAALSEILVELRVLSAEEVIAKIKMSDVEQILLETREGFAVNMGNSENIHAKLKAMLYIRDYLDDVGVAVGTIDVSNPEQPTYIPR